MSIPGDEPIEYDDSEPTFGEINHWQEVEITVPPGFRFHGFKPGPERKEAKTWECPRCHAVNAPHVEQCSCGPDEDT